MDDSVKEILARIDELLNFIAGLNAERPDKLRLLKTTLELKARFLDFLSQRTLGQIEVKQKPLKNSKDKEELILGFMRTRGGKVGADDFMNLGIASRTLRRYLKKLKDEKRIVIEKSGRNYFYKILTA